MYESSRSVVYTAIRAYKAKALNKTKNILILLVSDPIFSEMIRSDTENYEDQPILIQSDTSIAGFINV